MAITAGLRNGVFTMDRAAKQGHTVGASSANRYWVPMVDQTLRVLGLFHGDATLSLPEVEVRAGVAKSSTYRIIRTLERLGYLEKDLFSGKYQAGRKTYESAAKLHHGRTLVRLAASHMVAIRERFRDTVTLATFQDVGAVFVESMEGIHPLRFAIEQGTFAPAHASASGKVLLAHLSASQLASVLALPLSRFTPKTLVDRESLAEALSQIRQRGHAIEDEELEIGSFSVAVPMLERSGRVFALALSGPAHRLRPQRKEVVTALIRACDAITRDSALQNQRR